MKHKRQTCITHKLSAALLLLAFLAVEPVAYGYDYRNRTFYFDNSNTEWTTVYLGVANNGWSEFNRTMTKVPGTDNLYYYSMGNYWSDGGCYFFTDLGWSGSNQSFCGRASGMDDSDHSRSSFTYNQDYTDGTIETAGPDHTASGSDCGSKQMYTKHSAKPSTYTVTISAPTGGSISITYKDWSYSSKTSTDKTKTSGSFTVVPTCKITVTTSPTSGYGFESVTIGGTTYYTSTVSDYVVNANTTVSATFCAAPSFSSGTITVSPDGASACPGTKTLSVAAATGGQTPYRYQWFRNTTSSTTGGVAVSQKYTENQNGRIYKPSTTDAGTFYYYCVVSGGSCEAERKSAISGSVTIDATHALVVSPAAQRVKAYEPVTINAINANVRTWSLSPAKSSTNYLYEESKRKAKFKGAAGAAGVTATYTITATPNDALLTCPGKATVIVEADGACEEP